MRLGNSKNIFNKIFMPLSLVMTIAILSGCSVGMALNGKKEPDLSVVKQNAPRADVEIQLGLPIKVENQANGHKIATYEYEIGNEASTGRAVAHGVMDVMTLGIWEIVGTPVEACKGTKMHIAVTYDHTDHVISALKKVAS